MAVQSYYERGNVVATHAQEGSRLAGPIASDVGTLGHPPSPAVILST